MYKRLILIFGFIFIITGCTNHNAHVDEEKKLNDDERINYILKQLNNSYGESFEIEFVSSNEIKKCGFWLDNCFNYYVVENAYEYEYKVVDSAGIISYVWYTDSYYDDKQYFDVVYEDNYSKIKEKISYYNQFEMYVRDYFDSFEVNDIKFNFDKVNENELYLDIYFNFNSNDLSIDNYRNLYNLSYDYNKFNADTFTDESFVISFSFYIRAIFLDDKKVVLDYASIDNATIFKNYSKDLIPNDYYDFSLLSLTNEQKKHYDDIYNFLSSQINMNIDDIQFVCNEFMKYSKNYLYDVRDIWMKYYDYDYYGNEDIYLVYIDNYTKENHLLGIKIKLVYDEKKGSYVGYSISLDNGEYFNINNSTEGSN